MASSSILSALGDAEQQWSSDRAVFSEMIRLKIRVRNLEAFIVCARKLDKDADPKTLLVWVKDLVGSYDEEIACLCRTSTADDALMQWRLPIIMDEILALEDQIDEWYISMSNQMQRTISLTADDVLEMVDSILGNVADFPMIFRNENFHLVILISAMGALGEQMIFLKNFLNLAVETGVENRHLKWLLTHFEAVVIIAARFFLKGPPAEFDENWCREMQFKCYELLQKIKPVDSQVCQMYTEALNGLKSSRQVHFPSHVCQNFLDTLISDLWDLLRLDMGHLDSVKDQPQILYEGLRFLRTILKQQPKSFNQNIRDRIGALVCDAAILIFSFHQTHVETNPHFQALLEDIKVVQSEVKEEFPQPATFNFPNTNELGFVDSLLGNLMELISGNVDPRAKSLVQALSEDLSSLRSFLKETEEFRKEIKEVQPLWNQVLKVAFRVEFLIDQLAAGDVSDSLSLLSQSIIEEMVDIKTGVMKIPYGNKKDIKAKKAISVSSPHPPKRPPSTTNEAIIFDDKAGTIRNQLIIGSKQLRAVAIWGMAGVGKTFLASKIFNDPVVVNHFHVRAWCPVSQVLDKRSVLIQLLNQINETELEQLANKRKVLLELLFQINPKRFSELTEDDLADKAIILKEFLDQMNKMTEKDSGDKQKVFCQILDEIDPKRYSEMTAKDLADNTKVLNEVLDRVYSKMYFEMTEEDLANKVRRSLKGRRYLIFLDDVWTVEAWNSLQQSFPNDHTESRILVTSRYCNVVPDAMLVLKPHELSTLTKDESFKLLQSKLLHGKDWTPALLELGMQIADKCNGLPLIIVTVAGLLATVDQGSWKDIRDRLHSGSVSNTDQFMSTMELSYKHLPDHLKPCLLYFGAFLEDQEISVKRLIRLWIAEGFVQKGKVAEDYMRELIERSLVMVTKPRSKSGAKACRIHDLLHEYCLGKAKKENFFNLLNGADGLSDYNEPCYLRRLCIHDDGDGFKEAKLFCPRARTLLVFSPQKKLHYQQYWLATSFIIPIFKLLKVLDLEQIHIGIVFPSEIGLLLQLRYLSVQGGMAVIPASIGNLSNLETFVVHLETIRSKISLPHTLWNLKKLRWLSINLGGGILPSEDVDNSLVLDKLESISCVVIYSHDSMENQMRRFPNIHRLKCDLSRLFDRNHKLDKIVIPNFLSQLESLHLLQSSDLVMISRALFDFCLPARLKKLTLSGFGLPWEKLSSIGKLPYLEVLKLLDSCFIGDTWDVEQEDFRELEFLKLSRLDVVRWTADDNDQFPCLKKLVLDHCSKLEEIPLCLGSVLELESIVIVSCSDSLKRAAKDVEKEQVDAGNSSFEIRIR